MTPSADGLLVTTDPSLFDLDVIHGYLSRSYWSEGISRALVERALANSLCFALLEAGKQVGFARVVTDRATFAYLCDVFVLESHQGRGFGKLLVGEVTKHPELQGLRRFMLATRDAHGLYRRFGFEPASKPERLMEIVRPGLYLKPS